MTQSGKKPVISNLMGFISLVKEKKNQRSASYSKLSSMGHTQHAKHISGNIFHIILGICKPNTVYFCVEILNILHE